MEWEKDVTIEFIDLYKTFGVLWDPKHPLYFNKIRKQDAWEELSRIIGKPVEELKKKMESLNAGMRREKMKMAKSLGTGKGANEVYKSSWYAFNSMQFLWDKNKPRNTLRNLQEEATAVDGSANDEEEQLSETQTTDVPKPHSEPSTTRPEVNPSVDQNNSAPKKRPQTSTTGSLKRKNPRTNEDQWLDRAFEILESASAAPSTDECFHFGNFIAAKLREFDSRTRMSIQIAMMNVLGRASEGANPLLPPVHDHSSVTQFNYNHGSNTRDFVYPYERTGPYDRHGSSRPHSALPDYRESQIYSDSSESEQDTQVTPFSVGGVDEAITADSVMEQLSPNLQKK